MAESWTCDDVRELLPELSAGVTAGDDRARALAHVGGCAACRQELEAFSAVLDRLVLLAPEREPAPGFESSVLAALAPEPRPGPRWTRRRAVVLAAAAAVVAVALAVGVGAGWLRPAGDQEQVVATVTATGGGNVGQAVAHQGNPPWLFLDLDSAPAAGRYLVRLVTTADREVYVGWCRVRDGKGTWGWPVDVQPDLIREVQLVRDGTVVMRGRFG